MKTKQLLRSAFVAALFLVLTSCKKDDANFSTSNNFEPINEILSVGSDGLKGIDPSQVINGLESTYGENYDFSKKVRGNAVTVDNSTVYLCVIPSFWDDNFWMCVLVNNSAQIIGLYELEYLYYDDAKGENDEMVYPSYYINDIDNTIYTLFRGSIGVNIYGFSDFLIVNSNNIAIPNNYPYPLFNNVTAGNYSLGTCTYNVNDSVPEKALIAMRAATTFYNNFY